MSLTPFPLERHDNMNLKENPFLRCCVRVDVESDDHIVRAPLLACCIVSLSTRRRHGVSSSHRPAFPRLWFRLGCLLPTPDVTRSNRFRQPKSQLESFEDKLHVLSIAVTVIVIFQFDQNSTAKFPALPKSFKSHRCDHNDVLSLLLSTGRSLIDDLQLVLRMD